MDMLFSNKWKGYFHKNHGSVLVGNETQTIFANLLDQYHMTTLLSLVKKCTNTRICDKKCKKCTHFSYRTDKLQLTQS